MDSISDIKRTIWRMWGGDHEAYLDLKDPRLRRVLPDMVEKIRAREDSRRVRRELKDFLER